MVNNFIGSVNERQCLHRIRVVAMGTVLGKTALTIFEGRWKKKSSFLQYSPRFVHIVHQRPINQEYKPLCLMIRLSLCSVCTQTLHLKPNMNIDLATTSIQFDCSYH